MNTPIAENQEGIAHRLAALGSGLPMLLTSVEKCSCLNSGMDFNLGDQIGFAVPNPRSEGSKLRADMFAAKTSSRITGSEQISREVGKYPRLLVCLAPLFRYVRSRPPKNPVLRIAPGFGTQLASYSWRVSEAPQHAGRCR